MITLTTSKDHALHRLRIARGQISKLIDMVEQDESCINILHTSLSTRKALKHIDAIIMERYLRTCIFTGPATSEKDTRVDKLIKIYKYK